MAQTGRQTDKATWWSVTAFAEDEIKFLEDSSRWPSHIKKIYGGREECPETKKIHFQGAIQLNTQQRLTWFKTFLPTAHFEVARSSEALKKYAMKEETAVGEKKAVVNTTRHYTADEICVELAKSIIPDLSELEEKSRFVSKPENYLFETAVLRLLRKDRKLAGQLMNPSLRKWFSFTQDVWISYAREEIAAHADEASPEAEEEAAP